VVRVPFFLEPEYPEHEPYVETNRERLVKKWGGEAGWEAQKRQHNLKGRGLEAGIPHFNLDRRAANSMASHRLIQFVGKKYGLDASEEVYDLLNVYYFVDGFSLNDRPRLASVVAEKLAQLFPNIEGGGGGDSQVEVMSEADILNFLNGDEGRDEVLKAVGALRELGIHGIPKFIIEGQTVVDGAARSEVFVDIFRDIERRGSVRGGPVFGDVLGVPEEVVRKGSHRIDSHR